MPGVPKVDEACSSLLSGFELKFGVAQNRY
jgi:hypothetical protein